MHIPTEPATVNRWAKLDHAAQLGLFRLRLVEHGDAHGSCDYTLPRVTASVEIRSPRQPRYGVDTLTVDRLESAPDWLASTLLLEVYKLARDRGDERLARAVIRRTIREIRHWRGAPEDNRKLVALALADARAEIERARQCAEAIPQGGRPQSTTPENEQRLSRHIAAVLGAPGALLQDLDSDAVLGAAAQAVISEIWVTQPLAARVAGCSERVLRRRVDKLRSGGRKTS